MGNPNDRQYSNDKITVFWKPAKCIHATTCYRELIEVYNPRNRPWVNMKGASTERIIEVTNKCPTQAIYWKYNKDLDEPIKISLDFKDEVTPETMHMSSQTVEPSAKVSIMRDGPILVDGEFEAFDSDGRKLKPMLMTSFCRCGHSRTQPFCDGMHRKVGFIDSSTGSESQ